MLSRLQARRGEVFFWSLSMMLGNGVGMEPDHDRARIQGAIAARWDEDGDGSEEG
jgi:hypothetical protein